MFTVLLIRKIMFVLYTISTMIRSFQGGDQQCFCVHQYEPLYLASSDWLPSLISCEEQLNQTKHNDLVSIITKKVCHIQWYLNPQFTDTQLRPLLPELTRSQNPGEFKVRYLIC